MCAWISLYQLPYPYQCEIHPQGLKFMKSNTKPTGIILAAGGATRMGQPKSLLPLDNTTVISCHINALSTVCAEVIVVLGADASVVRGSLKAHGGAIRILENPKWAVTTQADSLCVALAAIDKTSAVLVTPVDTPPASAETLQSLCAAFPNTTVPLSPEGERGHPVMLSPATVSQILTSPMPHGLRPFLADAHTVYVTDTLMHLDFDTPNEWREFLSRWTNRP
jgi:molybdenum cofactor cytidylyltransferase